MNILFRVDGHAGVGFGHLVRCLALAKQLRDVHGVECAFFTQPNTPGWERIDDACYEIVTLVGWHPWERYRAYVFDLKNGASPEMLAVAPQNTLTVDLNLTDKSGCADMIFHPLVHEWFIKNTKWDDLPAQKFGGPEYALLRPEFAMSERVRTEVPHVFVSGGAADPKGIVLKVLHGLDGLGVIAEVMVSKMYPDMEKVHNEIACLPGIRFWINTEPERPWEIMAHCQLAVLSFGVTAFETMAMGLPTLAVSISDDHLSAANELSTSFGLASLGLADEVSESDITRTVRCVLDDCDRSGPMLDEYSPLKFMSRAARKAVDGLGVERVARTIVEAIT